MGGAVAVVSWITLVPWDLSERPDGTRSGDDYGVEIAIVGCAITAAGLGLALIVVTRRVAAGFAAGGLVTWAILFGWRAGTAEVSGANLFMVPLVIVFVPIAIVVPKLIQALVRRLEHASDLRR